MAMTKQQYLKLARRLARAAQAISNVHEDLENFEAEGATQLKLADEVLPQLGRIIYDFCRKGDSPALYPYPIQTTKY